jgi:phage terminase large subunit GpA-like protein
MKDRIVQQVVDKYTSRSEVGITKYGTTLENNNVDNYMIHLQQELMDATLYIEKIMYMNREITRLVKDNPNNQELGALIRKLVS